MKNIIIISKKIFILFLFSIYFETTEAKTIECENIGEGGWFVGKVKTCWMNDGTSIGHKHVTVSTFDASVKSLSFWNNKDIQYLPDQVNENFPNLIGYSADECSIKEISKGNFMGLNKLILLDLRHNKIEKIESYVFEDLQELRDLRLSKKKTF